MEKPNVGHLKAFGCLCYAHVEKDERQKFDAKARRCIMLGYGTETNLYRLYDEEREKVFFSREVVFNETMNGIDKEPEIKSSDSEHVELECVEEDTSAETVVNESLQPIIQLRRSTREQRQPDFYGERATDAKFSEDPTTLQDALASTDKNEWVKAMERELESLHENQVWDLVELPKYRKVVGSK